MELPKQAKLSHDERLSPIKFPCFPDSENSSAIPPVQSRLGSSLQDRNNHRDTYTPERILLSRRNTIASGHSLKTPHRVQKVFSLTSPRRKILPLTAKGFIENSIQSKGLKVVGHDESRSMKKNLRQGIDLICPLTETYYRSQSAEVSRRGSSVDTPISAKNYAEISVKPSMDSSDNGDLRSFGTYNQALHSPGLEHVKSTTITSLEPRRKSSQLSTESEDWECSSSKLVFSLLQFKDIQTEHLIRIKDLESIISEKNTELIKLGTRMADLESRLVLHQETLIKKQNELNFLQVQEKALNFQLDQYLSDSKRFLEMLKLKTLSLESTKALMIKMKELFESKIAQEKQACILSNQKLEETEAKLIDTKMNMSSLEKELTDMKADIIQLKEEKKSLEDKMEYMMVEKNSTLASHLILEEEILASKKQISGLDSEVREKNASLRSLTEKFDKLTKEAELLHGDMLNFESEQKKMEVDISAKSEQIHELETNEEHLRELLRNQDQQLKDLHVYCRDLGVQIQDKEKKLLDCQQKINDLEAQNDEKDKIISGDTRKLTELVQQVTEQKNVISEQKAQLHNLDKDAKVSTRESDELIKKLKRQILLAQEKTDQRIQEVAEQLYHQYSKKHEAKVTQLKLKYESKLEEKGESLEQKERLVESLRSQLQTEMKEKTYLLGVLEKGDRVKADNFNVHGRGEI